ncbi:hypothetical protein O6H91_05G013200 [Diphasiastrum complanatum]|uniref:Uncharacterized protein n=1 Tax=Diphasiastrum complanatum TaxID=34168 RepID=A0ACC2DKV0_DIPCM|nr:hypothetical protein O6H91_05G013200 [Diphasiastrum complanatum]
MHLFYLAFLSLLRIHLSHVHPFYQVPESLLPGPVLIYSMFNNVIRPQVIVTAAMLSFSLEIWFIYAYGLHVIILSRAMLLLRSLHHVIMGLIAFWRFLVQLHIAYNFLRLRMTLLVMLSFLLLPSCFHFYLLLYYRFVYTIVDAVGRFNFWSSGMVVLLRRPHGSLLMSFIIHHHLRIRLVLLLHLLIPLHWMLL